MRIAFVASEATPLAKTGGLADVTGALTRYLADAGHDVRLFMPLYASVAAQADARRPVPQIQNVPLQFGARTLSFSLWEAVLPNSRVPLFLIDCPELYERPELYSAAPDEHVRFLMLQRATLESCQRLVFSPEVIHCNDWHTALLPLLLKTHYAWDALFARTRTLLTIHNIGYQGSFPLHTASALNLPFESTFLHAGERLAGRVNWLRQGIMLADAVSTVSPTYAQEIATPLGGHGLDNSLRARTAPVVGILNGVDYSEWNPASDPHLPQRYAAEDLAGKAVNKQKLLQHAQLHLSPTAPLLGIISRLTIQKGFDLLFDTIGPILVERNAGLIVLGSGDALYESFFSDLTRQYPGRVAFRRGYDEALAHQIEAGADMFLMPSLYEPCGLNQMYSLKYGTVPIVRKTGGLADSVQMWNPLTGAGTGIVFNDFDATGLRWALDTALDLFADQPVWRRLMTNGMAQDFSWTRQGAEYVQLYEQLLAT